MPLTLPSEFPLLLAADWVDVLKALAPLFFILYWAVTNWLGRKGQPQRRPARPAPAPVPARPAPPAIPVGGSLREEVEEFRRRSGEDRGGPRPAPLAPLIRPAAEQPARRRPRPLAERPPAAPAAPSPSAEPRKLGQLAETLAQRAEERLASADTRLTSIERGDVERERHRHQTFDHQLGRLKDAGSRADGSAADEVVRPISQAAVIAAMLRDPAGVKQAIVLGEILNRPEGRWR